MSASRPLFSASLALLFGAGALADTITLKTGQKLEGKITAETDTELTVEVKVSAAVTDEQKVLKADIEKIDKEQPDEVAWQALKDLKPAANSLPLPQYDAVLRPLQAFVNDYPKSAHAAAANQSLAIFSGEKQRVKAGEVRLGEKWLSKEEVEKERVQISGLLIYQYMRSQRTAGDLIGTLNSFDQLEKTFSGSKSYPDAVETAREALATLKATVERMQAAFKDAKAIFDAGLAASSPQQKPELLAARQRELAQGEAALAAAEQAKIKWPTLVPRSDKNLDAIAKKIPQETQRLSRIDIPKLRQSVQFAEQAEKDLAAKKSTADEAIAKALTLWSNNELAKRLQPQAAALKVATAEQAKIAAEQARAAATPKTTPRTTPRPRPAVADAPAAPEPEKPFFLTVGGIVTILVLLGAAIAGWMVYNKIRHRANDVLE